MFVKNTWYVAAWAEEVTRELMSRKFLNTPVVMYRTEKGEPVALEDACPHRYYPLSKGVLKGDSIQCGYHGMVFGCSGKCERIPGQEQIPKSAKVRSFPMVERWGWLWIWMGDPELADPEKIIDIPQLRTDQWHQIKGERIYYKGSYKLMLDNLLDPSHVPFVHPTIFSSGNEAEYPVDTASHNGFVTVSRMVPKANVPPIFRTIKADLPEKMDRYQVYRVSPPSLCVIETGVVETGDWKSVVMKEDTLTEAPAVPEGDERKVYSIRGFDFMTPETESTTHYFWFLVTNVGVGDEQVKEKLRQQGIAAFAEDIEVVEGIQARVEQGNLPPQSVIGIDRGYIQLHRMLEKMLEAEKA
ncbi:hypothetical protein BTH42_10250 [Burkholderia sp. SRS-W-2-2016]|uniref:aromatic ring-hydroxylating dioxygenase subunit alpha n=1 Tax=Burkholderia sp. SRS-W-2-2016 TaxID=1926878 RepID=UPI00094A9D2A|nr:aromatic ring-hydroxylating dioxygenase subunit alpha [Burkholderia sp. SRS-W-2-2016]OLL31688.1 hypothetical protein BTH42_10250 [Burkholderia sp. SRS-W-2-2016]